MDIWHNHEKILVCGSRSFSDYDLLNATLDRLTMRFIRIVVLSGAAEGADTLGEKWAHSWWWSVLRYHPDYQTHGKKAPLVRNSEMVDYATRAVCFWDGKSTGTADTIEKAKRKGIPTKIIRF